MRERDVALAQAAAYPEVEMVERSGFKIEDYFAGSGGGSRGLLVLQDIAAPEGVEANCLHGPSLTFSREFPVLRGSPEARKGQLAHEDELFRELIVDLREELLVRKELLLPFLAVQ